MESLVEVLLWAALTYVIVRVFFAVVDAWLVSKLEKKIDEIQQDLELGRLIPLTVEVDGNTYLCYNSVTQEFVCQGANLKEIQDRFKARFPDKSAAIHKGDAEAVKILKSQLKEPNENINSIRRTS